MSRNTRELICPPYPGTVYGSGHCASDPNIQKQIRFFAMTSICAVQSRGAGAAVLHGFLCNMKHDRLPVRDYGGADGISWQGTD